MEDHVEGLRMDDVRFRLARESAIVRRMKNTYEWACGNGGKRSLEWRSLRQIDRV